MKSLRTAFLHYSAPPVTGGVEAVIEAHARVFLESEYPVQVIAGRGELSALPEGASLAVVPEMDTQNPRIMEISTALDAGRVPDNFMSMRDSLANSLRPLLSQVDVLIVHNVFTKHFNLPLTAALFDLTQQRVIPKVISWCHDLTWTSSHSRSKVFPGYPWDLLRIPYQGVEYVTISEQRRQEMASLYGLPEREIAIIYNGVDPRVWYGLTPEGWELAQRMDLFSGNLILLMPVRITQAKNIELAERVLAALKGPSCNPRLVVTGPPDPHDDGSMAYYRSLLDLRNTLGLDKELRFVFESGPQPGEPFFISQQMVSGLLRVSDLLFMPSHREGFGMPVLEAGLVGLPVVVSDQVPAARELGNDYVYRVNSQATPDEISRLILDEVINSRPCRFRREVRQNFTWERIFSQKIEPSLWSKPA